MLSVHIVVAHQASWMSVECPRLERIIVVMKTPKQPAYAEDLLRLATEPSPPFRQDIVAHGVFPDWLLAALADNPDIDVRCGLAARQDLPERLVRKIAKDPADLVRISLAGLARQLPDDVRGALVRDPSVGVRNACAMFRNDLKRDDLMALARDPSWRVRWSLGGRRELPRNIAELLLRDADTGVRAHMAVQLARGDGSIPVAPAGPEHGL